MTPKHLITAICLLGAFSLGTGGAFAQPQVSVKTNALYWATATPNLAVEIGLSPRLTLEVGGGANPFGSADQSFEHWLLQPELRWWFGRRFAGTFIGLHLHAGTYDVYGIEPLSTLKNNRYDGRMTGAGVSVGRHWLLGRRWGVEAEAGFGFARMRYDKYPFPLNDNATETAFKNTYFGPTRLNLSVVYYLR